MQESPQSKSLLNENDSGKHSSIIALDSNKTASNPQTIVGVQPNMDKYGTKFSEKSGKSLMGFLSRSNKVAIISATPGGPDGEGYEDAAARKAPNKESFCTLNPQNINAPE